MSQTASQESTQYRGSTTNASYYFCIEGLPERYTWQDLKDLIRQVAAHGIWTEMGSSIGQTGRTGWARLQRKDEASRLFDLLAKNGVQGETVRIHLFDTSSSPPRLIAHTCHGACIVASSVKSAPAPPQSVSSPVGPPAITNPSYNQQPPMSPTQPVSPYAFAPAPAMRPLATSSMDPAYSMLQAGMANMRMDTNDFAGRSRLAQPYGYPLQVSAQRSMQSQAPVYISSPQGAQVNVRDGIVRTEIRAVFVGNIDYKASTKELEKFFGRAGKIVKCQLQKDPVTGKSKGNATVQYSTAAEAENAVRMFDKEKFMSMRLKVRLVKESVAVGAPIAGPSRTAGNAAGGRSTPQSRNIMDPVIVDGSSYQR